MAKLLRASLWALALPAILVMGLVLLLMNASNDAYRWLIDVAASHVIDREIDVHGTFDFEFGMRPVLRVTDAVMADAAWTAAAGQAPKPMLHIGLLEIQFDLKHVFDGALLFHRLHVEDAQLQLQRDRRGRVNWDVLKWGMGANGSLSRVPFIDTARLSNIRVDFVDEAVGRQIRLDLDELTKHGGVVNDGLGLTGHGAINNRSFNFEGELGGLDVALERTTPYPLSLRIDSLGLAVDIDGQIDDLRALIGIDLAVDAKTPELSRLWRTFALDVPINGSARAAFRLRGRLGDLRLDEFSLLVDDPGFPIHAVGAIGQIGRGGALSVDLDASLSNSEVLALTSLPRFIEDASIRRLTGRLEGDFSNLAFTDLRAVILRSTGAQHELTGTLNWPIGKTKVLRLTTRDLMLPELAPGLPDLGPLEARAEIAWDEHAMRLRAAELEGPGFARLRLQAEGLLGPKRGQGRGYRFLPEITLAAQMREPSPLLRLLDDRSGESAMAVAVHGRGRIAGNASSRLQQHLADLGYEPGPVDGAIGPRTRAAIEKFQTDHGLPADGLMTPELAAVLLAAVREDRATASTFSNRHRTLARWLSGLGKTRAQATFTRPSQEIRLDEFTLASGDPAKASIQVNGHLAGIGGGWVEETALDIRITASLPYLLREFTSASNDLGRIEGKLTLTGSDGRLGIEQVSLHVRDSDVLSANLQGAIGKLGVLDEIALRTTIRVADTRLLAQSLGIDTEFSRPLRYVGTLGGSSDAFAGEGSLTLGATDFRGHVRGTIDGSRPQLHARIRTDLAYAADLGWPPPRATDTAHREAKPDDETDPLFDDQPLNLEALNAVDFDIDLTADAIKGAGFEIESLRSLLRLRGGRLELAPLLLRFTGGYLEGRVVADASSSPPDFELDLIADDVDLGDFLLRADAAGAPLNGNLDLAAKLSSQGSTTGQVTDNLNGSVELAIENGSVRSSLLDLAVNSPLRWLVSRAAATGQTVLNCLLVQFAVKDGIAASELILLDTENVRALGVGEIDIAGGTLDIEVQPRAKERRLVSVATPFRIEGPLGQPRIEVDVVEAQGRLVGTTVLAPLNVLSSLFSILGGEQKETSTCRSLAEENG